MKTMQLIAAFLRINEPCDVVFKDKNNSIIETICWENLTNVKTALYHEKVQVAKLNSLSKEGRKRIRIKFLEDSWRNKLWQRY